MTRAEFIDHIAAGYAKFETQYPGQKLQPLDTNYVFYNGRRMIECGHYKPRGDWTYMDKGPYARDARKRLPYWRKLIAEAD